MPRKQATSDPERQLMIKTKACQRLLKEAAYYKQEVIENESTLAEMKAENRDRYDIKKFQEVLDESNMMIPDSKSRLHQALLDLATYVRSSEVESFKSCEWYTEATALLSKELEDDPESVLNVRTSVADLKDGEAF